MTIKHQELRKRLLRNPKVKEEYDRLEPEYVLIDELITARILANLTQTQLAEIMGTTQSQIARLESGRQLPSLRTLFRYAEATGTKPEIRLIAEQERENKTSTSN